MIVALSIALATPAWRPVWSGAVDDLGPMPHVELLGVDDDGGTAWLRVGDGPRRTTALWQVDLARGRRTGVWRTDGDARPSFGSLAPLVDDPDDLARLGLLQAHIAGRPSWPALAVEPLGRWLAWEHGDPLGNDAVTLRTVEGPRRLGTDDLVAVYRPRFHPEHPLVAYTGATASGAYQVVVEHVERGQRWTVDGVTHAAQLDWDAHGGLWATGDGCVARVPRLPGATDSAPLRSDVVACGSDVLHTRMSPDGRSIVVADPSPDAPSTLLVSRFATSDGALVGRAHVPGGRSLQALSDDGWLLLTTRDGADLVFVGEEGPPPVHLDAPALGALHDHWPDGRTLAMVWDPAKRIVTLGWAQPPSK